MRVLMLTPQPFFEPRGSCYQVLHRVETLTALGHEIDFVTYHVGETPAVEGLTVHRIWRVPGINKVKVGPSLPKIVLDVLLFVTAIRLLLRNHYDLIHAHEEAGFLGVLLRGVFHTKLLYEMHSSLPQQLSNFNFYAARPVVNLFQRLERWALAHSDAVITICVDLQNHVAKINPAIPHALLENVGDAAPQHRQPIASHNGKADSTESSLIATYGLDGRPVILYAGTFERYQGLEMLLEAVAEVRRSVSNALFLLVGGKPDQIEALRRRAQELRLQDAVVFTGMVPQDDIPGFLEVADILVSPRLLGTNTPLKIYGYMRTGKPIVATDLWTHTQVLTPEVAILTRPNAEDFAAGLIHVLNDAEYGRRLAEAALRLAEEKYSYQHFVQETKRLYDGIEPAKAAVAY